MKPDGLSAVIVRETVAWQWIERGNHDGGITAGLLTSPRPGSTEAGVPAYVRCADIPVRRAFAAESAPVGSKNAGSGALCLPQTNRVPLTIA
jgi:hypothetical protein